MSSMNESPIVSDASSTMSLMGRACVAAIETPGAAPFVPTGPAYPSPVHGNTAANVPDRSSAANSIIDRSQLVKPLAQVEKALCPLWMQRSQDNSGPARPRSSSANGSGKPGRLLPNSTADRITSLNNKGVKVKAQSLKDKSPNRDDVSDSSGQRSPRGTSSLNSITKLKKTGSQFGTMDSADTSSWIHCGNRSSASGSVAGAATGGITSGVLCTAPSGDMEVDLFNPIPGHTLSVHNHVQHVYNNYSDPAALGDAGIPPIVRKQIEDHIMRCEQEKKMAIVVTEQQCRETERIRQQSALLANSYSDFQETANKQIRELSNESAAYKNLADREKDIRHSEVVQYHAKVSQLQKGSDNAANLRSELADMEASLQYKDQREAMVMGALKYSEEVTESLHTEGVKMRKSYISFHATASEGNANLQAAYEKAQRLQTVEAEAALKWEKLAYDHYVIIQGEEQGREREHGYLVELGELKDASSLHSEHLEAKTHEMMKAAHGEHEQHQLLLNEFKEAHVQKFTAQRLREECNFLEEHLAQNRIHAEEKQYTLECDGQGVFNAYTEITNRYNSEIAMFNQIRLENINLQGYHQHLLQQQLSQLPLGTPEKELNLAPTDGIAGGLAPSKLAIESGTPSECTDPNAMSPHQKRLMDEQEEVIVVLRTDAKNMAELMRSHTQQMDQMKGLLHEHGRIIRKSPENSYEEDDEDGDVDSQLEDDDMWGSDGWRKDGWFKHKGHDEWIYDEAYDQTLLQYDGPPGIPLTQVEIAASTTLLTSEQVKAHAELHPQLGDATATALAEASQAEIDAILDAELAETLAQTGKCVLKAGHRVHLAVAVKRGDRILHPTSMTGIKVGCRFMLGTGSKQEMIIVEELGSLHLGSGVLFDHDPGSALRLVQPTEDDGEAAGAALEAGFDSMAKDKYGDLPLGIEVGRSNKDRKFSWPHPVPASRKFIKPFHQTLLDNILRSAGYVNTARESNFLNEVLTNEDPCDPVFHVVPTDMLVISGVLRQIITNHYEKIEGEYGRTMQRELRSVADAYFNSTSILVSGRRLLAMFYWSYRRSGTKFLNATNKAHFLALHYEDYYDARLEEFIEEFHRRLQMIEVEDTVAAETHLITELKKSRCMARDIQEYRHLPDEDQTLDGLLTIPEKYMHLNALDRCTKREQADASKQFGPTPQTRSAAPKSKEEREKDDRKRDKDKRGGGGDKGKDKGGKTKGKGKGRGWGYSAADDWWSGEYDASGYVAGGITGNANERSPSAGSNKSAKDKERKRKKKENDALANAAWSGGWESSPAHVPEQYWCETNHAWLLFTAPKGKGKGKSKGKGDKDPKGKGKGKGERPPFPQWNDDGSIVKINRPCWPHQDHGDCKHFECTRKAENRCPYDHTKISAKEVEAMPVPESYRVRIESINAGKGDPGFAKGKGKGKGDGKDKGKGKEKTKAKDAPKGKDKAKEKVKGGAKGYAAWDGGQGDYGNDASWQDTGWGVSPQSPAPDFTTVDQRGDPLAFEEKEPGED